MYQVGQGQGDSHARRSTPRSKGPTVNSLLYALTYNVGTRATEATVDCILSVAFTVLKQQAVTIS